ncbi:MAG: hypothetical protein ACRDF4_06365 [Rhabdochlamydiaceae bacterium]
MGKFVFRDLQDGSLRQIDAPSCEEAWEQIIVEYSDPIHAYEDWVYVRGEEDG